MCSMSLCGAEAVSDTAVVFDIARFPSRAILLSLALSCGKIVLNLGLLELGLQVRRGFAGDAVAITIDEFGVFVVLGDVNQARLSLSLSGFPWV
jgi:hypothetical protein